MTTHFAMLDSRGVLEVRGPDAVQFLQGQTTCDLRELTPERPLPGACCNPQGRVLFDFHALLVAPERVALCMGADMCELSAAALGKYIVFSKAELVNATADWVQVGCWGDGAQKLSEERQAGDVWARRADDGSRQDILAPRARGDALRDWLGQRAQRHSEDAWREQEIRAGLGHIEPATSGRLLPQELNYQATGHVSFNKGCYTGQEIVARLHYKGKTKRPMQLARYPSAVAPAAGTDIVSSGGVGLGDVAPGDGRAVGTVINSVARGDQVWLLASVGAADSARVDGTQTPLEILPLPYSLDGYIGLDG